ncbi:hypothetical protein FRC00_013731 [Tulasnella sp. 408]|nr:hypothetical protein FRC00_013731 [Tulasnella sp. 408]
MNGEKNPADVASVLQDAFQALLRTESSSLLDRGIVLTNTLRDIERILADEQVNADEIVQHAFELIGEP